MCIAYIAIGSHPEWPLLIAANRDEFHSRPTLAAAPWVDRPDIIAGKDCVAKGSWLGITRQGRFALLTNYREPGVFLNDAPSRGQLVSRYLQSELTPEHYANAIHQQGSAYNGFNLLIGDSCAVWYVSNRGPRTGPEPLSVGRYVLTNHSLDATWPKAERLRRSLDDFSLDSLHESVSPVLCLLKDATIAEDHLLPNTGLSLEQERLLSSPFIVSPDYGTRCSTVIAMNTNGNVAFSEVSYSPAGVVTERHDWPFAMKS